MDDQIDVETLCRERFPSPLIRGFRVVRETSQPIGDFRLDASTACFLGVERVGVLVENCDASIETVIRNLLDLAHVADSGQFLLVPAKKRWAGLVHCWTQPGQLSGRQRHHPRQWEFQNMLISTVEGLVGIGHHQASRLSAILIVDHYCGLWRARGRLATGVFIRNDRPQRIVDFREHASVSGWAPPVLLFTHRHARSLETNRMLQAYSLQAWWFVDGSRLRIGPPPHPRPSTDE